MVHDAVEVAVDAGSRCRREDSPSLAAEVGRNLSAVGEVDHSLVVEGEVPGWRRSPAHLPVHSDVHSSAVAGPATAFDLVSVDHPMASGSAHCSIAEAAPQVVYSNQVEVGTDEVVKAPRVQASAVEMV